jgi:hypothetical protein
MRQINAGERFDCFVSTPPATVEGQIMAVAKPVN